MPTEYLCQIPNQGIHILFINSNCYLSSETSVSTIFDKDLRDFLCCSTVAYNICAYYECRFYAFYVAKNKKRYDYLENMLKLLYDNLVLMQ